MLRSLHRRSRCTPGTMVGAGVSSKRTHLRRVRVAASLCVVLAPWNASGGQPDAASPASAYPSRPVRIVVPYAPGGGIDILARLVGRLVGERWEQSIIIDNRPGGNAVIGTDIVARAAPDGHSLLFTSSTHSVMPSLYSKLAFDPVNDFSAAALIANGAAVLLVHPTVPADTFKSFLAWARARPSPVSYGSSGMGGSGHLAMELLKTRAGIDLVHVPYKGMAPALNDLVGGRVQVMFGNLVPSLPHVKSGRLRALAVSSAKRMQAAADIPTVAESGMPDFEVSVWLGLLAPARVPAAVIARINEEYSRSVRLPEVNERLVALGFEPATAPPDAFARTIRDEVQKWAALAKRTNLKAE